MENWKKVTISSPSQSSRKQRLTPGHRNPAEIMLALLNSMAGHEEVDEVARIEPVLYQGSEE
jgi:hypothetical protein